MALEKASRDVGYGMPGGRGDVPQPVDEPEIWQQLKRADAEMNSLAELAKIFSQRLDGVLQPESPSKAIADSGTPVAPHSAIAWQVASLAARADLVGRCLRDILSRLEI